jgi:pimeloyl-ACP methyl ester carboxylesterase
MTDTTHPSRPPTSSSNSMAAAWHTIHRHGQPIVLCSRFRGNMDTWDPAFLDGLASQGFQVITFDYTGWGFPPERPPTTRSRWFAIPSNSSRRCSSRMS